MTAQKLLGWSKSGAKGSWLLVVTLVTMLWLIVAGVFKLAYALAQLLPDDAFETKEDSWPMSEAEYKAKYIATEFDISAAKEAGKII